MAIFATCALLASCSDDVTGEYSRLQAFFLFKSVTSAAPLHTAVNNPGQWCTIRTTANAYLFHSATGLDASWTLTAPDLRARPTAVAGFIVGTPSIPDVSGQFSVWAFDLVCPNCYRSDAIQRSLDFSADALEEVFCSRCGRTYSLRNRGIVTAGQKGRKLYRYHAQYNPATDTFLIQNG